MGLLSKLNPVNLVKNSVKSIGGRLGGGKGGKGGGGAPPFQLSPEQLQRKASLEAVLRPQSQFGGQISPFNQLPQGFSLPQPPGGKGGAPATGKAQAAARGSANQVQQFPPSFRPQIPRF